MIIDRNNYNNSNNIYVHDSMFSGFSYDYHSKKIILECIQKPNNIWHQFVFYNVALLEMQSCSFWGGGNNIMWLDFGDPEEKLDRLIELQKRTAETIDESRVRDTSYISAMFTLNSGDNLSIICESIDYRQEPMGDTNSSSIVLMR